MKPPPIRRNGEPPGHRPPYPAPPYKLLPPPPYRPIPYRPSPSPFRSPKKKHTYHPWEVDVTLCIAALCLGDKPMCVLSADYKVESSIAGGDFGMEKMHRLGGDWYCLLAGPVAECMELFDLYNHHLLSVEIDKRHVIEHLQEPLNRLRKHRANRVTQKMAALSHREFMRLGKERLSPELHRQIEYAISNERIEAQMILVGLVDRNSTNLRMFLISDDGVLEYVNFCAIGSGATVAEAILYQREHSYLADPEEALYAVYEAAKIGRIAPGVGQSFSMSLLRPVRLERNIYEIAHGALSDRGESFLAEAFEKYGPKPLPRRMDHGYSEMMETHDPRFVAEVFHRNEEANDSESAASSGEQEAKE